MTSAVLIKPGRFVHRPTRIEAMQWTEDSRLDVLAWLLQAGCLYWMDATGQMLRVMTPQNARPVGYGDWVVRGIAGEWYAIKNDVFVKAYESTEPDRTD